MEASQKITYEIIYGLFTRKDEAQSKVEVSAQEDFAYALQLENIEAGQYMEALRLFMDRHAKALQAEGLHVFMDGDMLIGTADDDETILKSIVITQMRILNEILSEDESSWTQLNIDKGLLAQTKKTLQMLQKENMLGELDDYVDLDNDVDALMLMLRLSNDMFQGIVQQQKPVKRSKQKRQKRQG